VVFHHRVYGTCGIFTLLGNKMNYIEPKEGKVYDLSIPNILRPFDLELARQGHPLAWVDAREIRLLRKMGGNIYSYDYWDEDGWVSCDLHNEKSLDKNLRLAPLAGKDGKPLHVGDVIEVKVVMFGGDGWRGVAVTMDNWHRLNICGRWPVEVKA
jgi:hypothetical protein